MPKNALAKKPSNALNFAPYEGRYRFQTTPNGAVATDVEAALVPLLMRAHFPEYVQNARATISDSLLPDRNAYGEYTKSAISAGLGPQIQINPRGVVSSREYNAMNMLRTPEGDYIGAGNKNITSDTVLNALSTMLHEGYHARMQPDFFSRRDANASLKKMMGADKYSQFMNELEMTALPSVQNPKLTDELRLNEFLSTAVPTKQMLDKGLKASSTLEHAKEIQFLTNKYPELKSLINQWSQPEKQTDTTFTLR